MINHLIFRQTQLDIGLNIWKIDINRDFTNKNGWYNGHIRILPALKYLGLVNGCSTHRRYLLGAVFISVWDTFPCYLVHFGAKTCTLLNILDLKCAIRIVHWFFHGFSRFFRSVHWFTQSVHRFVHSVHWVFHGFNRFFHGFDPFSMHNMHLVNM